MLDWIKRNCLIPRLLRYLGICCELPVETQTQTEPEPTETEVK